jgi:hypothetical protein
MTAEANVAVLHELLDRVQRNRLKLAEARSQAAEAAPAPAVGVAELDEPEAPPVIQAAPAPAPVPHAEPEAELEPLPDEPALAASEPFEGIETTPVRVATPVAAPIPAPIPAPIAARAAATAPAPSPALPDLEPRTFAGEIDASGPVASVSERAEPARPWSMVAVLTRAWKLGR